MIQQGELLWQRQSVNTTAILSAYMQSLWMPWYCMEKYCDKAWHSRKNYCVKEKVLIPASNSAYKQSLWMLWYCRQKCCDKSLIAQLFIVHALLVNAVIQPGNCCDKEKALIPQLFIVHAIIVKAMKLHGSCCNKLKALIPQPFLVHAITVNAAGRTIVTKGKHYYHSHS